MLKEGRGKPSQRDVGRRLRLSKPVAGAIHTWRTILESRGGADAEKRLASKGG